ncbi:MAG: hypothetical protein UU40_C0011G0020 [Candidatus Uhrbacteria bacterium GW2011_GWD2_41_121]|uniref:Uncharacterized protein n=1 Tax=Candidatus Uhrbacteria bacterium GW2011_GWC1_41_20 TaxID=1618983 RepID=A0A0G0VH16_9BACT|nr:MAG: hypothetical protein UT52_C0013G0020 [Candidatus Uhrbacteria bacterium GW2011_GWE1_39_46]KKR63812.1 MAG: hypothetical protein UU04_C0011G0002 [Candidatus Uhrbacteria bacterium GW2011_GWC2_40_450]KKR89957.1 MAG: hypothetical protein UU40_C0011G0020 [Candidatus Uhrbacteria bacterium GW2011_GWD2_41_121]KKR95831.1 MAG: hypothetical protein UU46_C0013G0020 [Candidatus Uhrbacteria bacterium GW2011_GWD1_41_16]KKR98941.1 MAG: hypothetical protein UU50_C0013G0020 [Candidatus Uhrbacteria bacteriu
MGRPTGIEPVIEVPQTPVITVSPWPPYFKDRLVPPAGIEPTSRP